ncbi:ATP-binding cassette domain-containing protein [Massilia antarctica]|uniref:ATP-binding cassette domain-containing protein n=1 Tax=Massilia antarctica TaxID=2765360 RepID=A0AA48WFR9_9BURK|nr:ATP-binding cassette domain-containing protein [Massilia antarctica]QPI51201.1 ATP-binding cassette domain-containing protein [Massilia antarctica]
MEVEQQPLLRIEGLHFHFDTRPVFSDFSAAIEAGITWLRGANGMGKTTLLKLVAGALAPKRGSIALGGVDCAAQPLAYRLATFYCGGDLPDLPWLTVQEFLDLHLALYPDAQARLVERQLEAFGVVGTLGQALSTLSLGQHKKVQLALALALPVRLLLLDEPFNGLDAAAVEYLRAQLGERGARQDAWVLLTSHLEPLVEVKRMLDLDR